jgi:hypothetical protein
VPDDADFIGSSRRKSCDKGHYHRISPLAQVSARTLVQRQPIKGEHQRIPDCGISACSPSF